MLYQAFPVTTIATALALLLGIGGASNYNLEMGAGYEEKASGIAGTALSSLVSGGVILAGIILLFLKPLLTLFGATADVMPYAVDYTDHRISRTSVCSYNMIILKSVLLQNSSDRNYIEYVERGWSLLGKR